MGYSEVIDVLTYAKERVTAILDNKQDEHHKLKLQSTLDREIKYLSLLTQTATPESQKLPQPGPATTIAGQPIPTRNDVKRADLEPSEEKIRVLREKVEGTYKIFLTTESLDLLRNYDDNIIRGVAKKAKMKVTKEDPESITLDFIEEIKQNIREQEKRNQDMQKLKENGLEIKAGSQEEKDFYSGKDIVDSDAQEEKKETGEQDQEDKNNPDPHYNKNSGEWENLPDASEVREEKGIKSPDVAKTPPDEIEFSKEPSPEQKGKRKK